MSVLFWLSVMLICYGYFGYPFLLLLLTKEDGTRRTSRAGEGYPTFTMIITAFNEEQSIQKKLQNTLAIREHERARGRDLQILVASDASSDRTDEIVTSFASQGVELARLPERGGKEKAQGFALSFARGEILFFTDTKVTLEVDAVERLETYFQDARVGAVSTHDRVEGENGGEGAYVRYEMWLRRLESNYSSLVGLSGSAFAVRKRVCANWRTNVPSDFAVLLEARRMGLRGIQADDIVATYAAVTELEQEFSRKVRTVLRGISTLASCAEALSPSVYGRFAFQLWSHKVCRWLVPWCFLISGISAILLAAYSEFYAFCALLWLCFVGLSVLGYRVPKLREKIYIRIPLFFSLANAAIAVASVQFIFGKRMVAWNPSQKGGK